MLSALTWYDFTVNNGGISKNNFCRKFSLKFSKIIYISETTIFLSMISIPFTLYVEYNYTANNAEVVIKNAIFQNSGLKFLKNNF